MRTTTESLHDLSTTARALQELLLDLRKLPLRDLDLALGLLVNDLLDGKGNEADLLSLESQQLKALGSLLELLLGRGQVLDSARLLALQELLADSRQIGARAGASA